MWSIEDWNEKRHIAVKLYPEQSGRDLLLTMLGGLLVYTLVYLFWYPPVDLGYSIPSAEHPRRTNTFFATTVTLVYFAGATYRYRGGPTVNFFTAIFYGFAWELILQGVLNNNWYPLSSFNAGDRVDFVNETLPWALIFPLVYFGLLLILRARDQLNLINPNEEYVQKGERE